MLLSPNILYLESIRLRASGETILVTSLPLKQFSGFSAGGFQSHLVSGHSQARGARPGDHHHPQLQRSKAPGAGAEDRLQGVVIRVDVRIYELLFMRWLC